MCIYDLAWHLLPVFKTRIWHRKSFSSEKSWGSGENVTLPAYEWNPPLFSVTHHRERNPSESNFFNLQEKNHNCHIVSVPKYVLIQKPKPSGLLYPYCSSVLVKSSSGSFERWVTTCAEVIVRFPRENEDFTEDFFFCYTATWIKALEIGLPPLKYKNKLSKWQNDVFFLHVTNKACFRFSTLL